MLYAFFVQHAKPPGETAQSQTMVSRVHHIINTGTVTCSHSTMLHCHRCLTASTQALPHSINTGTASQHQHRHCNMQPGQYATLPRVHHIININTGTASQHQHRHCLTTSTQALPHNINTGTVTCNQGSMLHCQGCITSSTSTQAL